MTRVIKPDLPKIALDFARLRPAGGFKVGYADPNWLYESYSEAGDEKNATTHYPCMETADIASLPVPALMADDSVMFMWVPWPMLEHWKVVYRGWGFEFAGLAWEWLKFNPATGKYAFGLGYGSRKNVEPCLLLTRGNPKMRPGSIEFFGETIKTGSRSVRDFIEEWPAEAIRAPRREHSRKPDEAVTRIETMFEGPYVELFARTKRRGWSSWGNETSKFQEAA